MHRRGFLTGTLSAAVAQVSAAPVVLELFTSQGCSSCPPADAFLGELTHQPRIIGLAWHVDYWNSLGWRDPYARREWTERQRAYANRLNEEIYTPALVVDGTTMLVGSNKAAVRDAIRQASPPSIAVTLRRGASGLEAVIDSISGHATMMLATYHPEVTTEVRAGENAGRRLTEYRVVQDIIALANPVSANSLLTPTRADPTAHLQLPSIPGGLGAVLIIQDASLRILGAADLPPDAG